MTGLMRAGMFGDKVARLLLAAHEKDCEEDRKRTDARFDEIKTDISGFRSDLRELMKDEERKHEVNVKALDSIKRYIFIAIGALSVIGFLLQHSAGIAELLGRH